MSLAVAGPNGAGKSTLIGILSGVLDATSGQQYIGGLSLKTDKTDIHKLVGICPQFDIVWGELTVAEHLTFQAEQRGVPPRLVHAEVQRVAMAVGLDGDGFRTQAARLSGGMRRRLSIGASMRVVCCFCDISLNSLLFVISLLCGASLACRNEHSGRSAHTLS